METINQKRNKYLEDAMKLRVLLKGKPINRDVSIKLNKKQDELWNRYKFFKNFQIAEGKIKNDKWYKNLVQVEKVFVEK